MGNESGYFNNTNLRRWKANYYGLITEVDEWIGLFMDKLDSLGISNETLVIFTSDHGEMLGSHGMRSKSTFYEEATHVPLLLRMPGVIQNGVEVDDPISHLDIHSTILDYMGVSDQYKSDGSSLRRLIEGEDEEDSYVVLAWNPTDSNTGGKPTDSPAFMIRKGNWKLILPNRASSGTLDMLYNLEGDPHEMNNLVGPNGMTADEVVLGKAEHMKALLVEYLNELDSPFAGEVRNRRQWRLVPFWVGDLTLEFRKPLPDGTRKEKLYIGSSSGTGNVTVTDVMVEGPGAAYFSIDWTWGEIPLDGYRVLTVTYTEPDTELGALSADLVIKHDAEASPKIVRLIASSSAQVSESSGSQSTLNATDSTPLPTAFSATTAEPTPSPAYATKIENDAQSCSRIVRLNSLAALAGLFLILLRA